MRRFAVAPAADTVELATPVDLPEQPLPGASSLLGADLKPAQLKPGVFSRAAHMREVARQQLANVPGGARYRQQCRSAAPGFAGLAFTLHVLLHHGRGASQIHTISWIVHALCAGLAAQC